MKEISKTRLIIYILVILALAAMLITATFAWYTLGAQKDVDLELKADGTLVLKFESKIADNPAPGKLVPAVEHVDALAYNRITPATSVRTTSEGVISQAAVPVTYRALLKMYTDKEGEGETSASPQCITLGLTAEITVDGETIKIPQADFEKIFDYELKMLSADLPHDGLQDLEDWETGFEAPALSQPIYQISGDPFDRDTVFYFTLKLWLAQPQGLLDPKFKDAKVVVFLSVAASAATNYAATE